MLVFRADPPDQQGIHCPAKPRGAKAERFDAREQQTQSRVKGDGHAGGDEHGQSLRVGQRFEHPPFLRFESQHRQKGDGDDQQSEKRWRGNFLHRRKDHGAIVLPTPHFFPCLQLLMRLFGYHDGGIDEFAKGDGHARERHDVGADSQKAEGNEGKQHNNRHGDDGNSRARKMP